MVNGYSCNCSGGYNGEHCEYGEKRFNLSHPICHSLLEIYQNLNLSIFDNAIVNLDYSLHNCLHKCMMPNNFAMIIRH